MNDESNQHRWTLELIRGLEWELEVSGPKALLRFSLSTQTELHVNIIMRNKRIVQVVLFTVLNVILLTLHGSAVPTRDLWVCVGGLIGCFLAVNLKREGFVLEKTKCFERLFAMVTFPEVLFTLVAPWVFILIDSGNGFPLAPHLFVFQAQIALEGIFTMGEGNSLLAYYFTAIANLYRGLALAAWASRTSADDRDIPLFLKVLPAIAICLWICSNLFILFAWYPHIQSMESPTRKKKK